MASSKDRYESSRFLAGRFAAGKWRGVGVSAVPISGVTAPSKLRFWTAAAKVRVAIARQRSQ